MTRAKFTRQRLPTPRRSVTVTLQVGGCDFTATTSRFDDGSLGEIVLQNHKFDSSAGIMASDATIATSLAPQFGCPIEPLRKGLGRDARGKAMGPLGILLDMLAAEDTDELAKTPRCPPNKSEEASP